TRRGAARGAAATGGGVGDWYVGRSARTRIAAADSRGGKRSGVSHQRAGCPCGRRHCATESERVSLLESEVRVINVGLETFANALRGVGVAVEHVDWRPPAGADPMTSRLLAE